MRTPGPEGASASPLDYCIVIPTLGRPSLDVLLASLDGGTGPAPQRVLVVDDRRRPSSGLGARDGVRGVKVEVLMSGARGPAAARNLGWRTAASEWIAFLDDDVVAPADWAQRLAADLAVAPPDLGASQGRIDVPLAAARTPTDWERSTKGLESARWATADMAYRRDALVRAGGFDERFPRAFREDADLALRATGAGWAIERGGRRVTHPVRPADRWVSVRQQRGNADDVLMAALHGPGWRRRAGAEAGRNGRHVLAVAAAAGALGAALGRRRAMALLCGAAWLAVTARFTIERVSPGPRTRREVTTMALTSALIPPAAVGHRLAGRARLARTLARRRLAPQPAATGMQWWSSSPRPVAVLFDRDGTLIDDVAYNGSPDRVHPLPGAADALARLRQGGVKVGLVTNQSGVARGLLTPAEVAAVHRALEAQLGAFDAVAVCPHDESAGCDCRKPAPGLVRSAAASMGVEPAECVVIGDIGSDVAAARAAGARAIMVPGPATRWDETVGVTCAPDLGTAVDLVLGDR